ncbi:MAG TPA: hypothetical protein GXX36_01470 [Clostridiaceae bacterium]|nr:hypothetical protein [Clostridiaceae bacterium]
MSWKKKYSNEFKYAIVKEYLGSHTGGYDILAAKYGIDRTMIRIQSHLQKNRLS